MSYRENAKDVTISMFDNCELSLVEVESIRESYVSQAQLHPDNDLIVGRLEGLEEAIDILKNR